MPPSKKKRGQAAGRQPADGQLLNTRVVLLKLQLLTAARDGDGAAVARILAVGVDPNASAPARDASGEVGQATALAAAAALGRLEVARLLLEAGADPNLAIGTGGTPLMAAAANGHPEVLRLLLARGAAVDAARQSTGSTAFHSACCNNHAECAEALAWAGCDVGLKTKAGQTGREVAEAQGHAEVLTRLRAVVADQLRAAQAAGAAPAPEPEAGDQRPATQLLRAARKGDVAAVSRLPAAGADPNASVSARTASGEVLQTTALATAAERGRPEAARLLLQGGADPDRARSAGDAPLMAGAVVGEQLRAAQAAGAVPAPEPEAAADGGLADQLMEASFGEGGVAAVSRLLAAGADPNASVTRRKASGDVTIALVTAAGNGRLEVVRLLLEGGANPSLSAHDDHRDVIAGLRGFTPLMNAARCGELEVLRLLLAYGAAVDAVGPDTGITAFHCACFENQAECAEVLMRAGCDVEIKDKVGWTGREMAEQSQGSKDLVRRLRALARQPFVGVLVELAGLVGAAEHNGKRATVRPGRVPAFPCSVSFLHYHYTCGGRMRSGVPPPAPPRSGAALPGGEAALHAGAAGAAGGGRRRGAPHGRETGELCAGAPAGRHAVRPGGPGGCRGPRSRCPVQCWSLSLSLADGLRAVPNLACSVVQGRGDRPARGGRRAAGQPLWQRGHELSPDGGRGVPGRAARPA
jgi:ankyrin repeat protein